MALDKRAWRCQKGHGAQEKGHGAAPCYFALDLTLHSCSVCPLERILHFVIVNSFIRSITDEKIELNCYDKIEYSLNVSLSANF